MTDGPGHCAACLVRNATERAHLLATACDKTPRALYSLRGTTSTARRACGTLPVHHTTLAFTSPRLGQHITRIQRGCSFLSRWYTRCGCIFSLVYHAASRHTRLLAACAQQPGVPHAAPLDWLPILTCDAVRGHLPCGRLPWAYQRHWRFDPSRAPGAASPSHHLQHSYRSSSNPPQKYRAWYCLPCLPSGGRRRRKKEEKKEEEEEEGRREEETKKSEKRKINSAAATILPSKWYDSGSSTIQWWRSPPPIPDILYTHHSLLPPATDLYCGTHMTLPARPLLAFVYLTTPLRAAHAHTLRHCTFRPWQIPT